MEMMVDFLQRSGDPMTDDQRRIWVEECLKEAAKINATWVRVSMHPSNKDLWVFEVCKEMPEREDLPNWGGYTEPRFYDA